MKKCISCRSHQSTGNFCSGCGGKLQEVVFDVPKGTKFRPIKSNRSVGKLKDDAKNWLKRIGIVESDINFASDGAATTIEYVLDGKRYAFTSFLQESDKNNWAAVEQFLHSRVIGIERGIESKEKAFEGYVQLEDKTNPRALFGLTGDFTRHELDARYKTLAKKHHPDVNSGQTEMFQKLTEAHEQLKREIE